MLTNFEQVFDNLKEEGPLPELVFPALGAQAEKPLKVVGPGWLFAGPLKAEHLSGDELHLAAEGKMFDAFLSSLPPTDPAAEGSCAASHPP